MGRGARGGKGIVRESRERQRETETERARERETYRGEILCGEGLKGVARTSLLDRKEMNERANN